MINDISEDVKCRYKISPESRYFILPEGISDEEATETDLILVKIREFVDLDPSIDYYPNGITVVGEKDIFDKDGNLTPKTINGKLIYKSIDGMNTIETASGIKIRHSFTSDAGYVEYEFLPKDILIGKFTLKYIFSVSRHIKLAINSCGDVYFDTFKDAEQYTRYLTFYGGELSQNDLVVVVNEKCIHYHHYDIFFDNAPKQIDHSRLFDYLCSNSKNESGEPSYLRVFPLRPEWFEVVPIV